MMISSYVHEISQKKIKNIVEMKFHVVVSENESLGSNIWRTLFRMSAGSCDLSLETSMCLNLDSVRQSWHDHVLRQHRQLQWQTVHLP
jgi:hypothetical protein